MEVISLNERERSTTILNTTPPSDTADDLAIDNGENYFPPTDDATPFDDDDSIATDPEADAAANTGVWTKKNKLLASIIAGTALLCAVAAGGGVAAHNARVAARANYCPAPAGPPVGAMPPPELSKAAKSFGTGGTAKSSKAGPGCGDCPTQCECVEAQCICPLQEVSAINLAPEEGGGVRRGLVANNHRNEQEVVTTPIGGEGAYYHVPKLVEDKRKNRMLAEHLGHRAVVTSSFSWGDYLNGVKFGFGGGRRRLGLEDVVSEVEEIGGGEEEVVTVGETAQDPSVVAATGGGSKGSKSSSGGGTAKSSKTLISPGLGEGVQCKCDPIYIGDSSGAKSAKAESPSTAKSSKTALTVDAAAGTATKSAKSVPNPSTAKSAKAGGLALSPTACGSIGGPTPSSKSVGNIVQEPKVSTKSVKEPSTPSVPAVPSPPVSPPATVTKPPMEPVKPPCEETDEGCEVPVPPVPTEPAPSPPTPSVNPPTPATEPNPPTPPTEPTDPSPTPPTEPSPSPPTPGSGGGEPNCDNDEDWISTNKKTCADLADDTTGLCDTEVNDDGESASDACPASCNEDCFEGNCDNDDDWASTNEETCADVANDTGLCATAESAGGESASDACPRSCNPDCRIPIIPIPVGSPTNPPITLETYKPTAGSTVTVGDPDSSAPNAGSRPTPPTDGIAPPPPTPMPTGLSTSLSTGLSTGTASFGGTVTVSTETTGPPTTEIRCGEDGQGDCDQ